MKRREGLNPLGKSVRKLKIVSDSKTNFFDEGQRLVKKLEDKKEITIQGKKIKLCS
jgi:hypothetical protein